MHLLGCRDSIPTSWDSEVPLNHQAEPSTTLQIRSRDPSLLSWDLRAFSPKPTTGYPTRGCTVSWPVGATGDLEPRYRVPFFGQLGPVGEQCHPGRAGPI